MKKKIFIILCLALALTALSFLFTSDKALIGIIQENITYRGFPLHFYEISNGGPQAFLFRLLPLAFFGDIFVYLIIVISVWYLLDLGLRKKKWYFLGAAIILGLVSFKIIAANSNSCVVGFPVEFYIVCEGESYITLSYAIYGYVFNFLYWFSISSIVITFFHKIFYLETVRLFLVHKNVWLTIMSTWVTILAVSLLGTFGDMKELIIGIILAIGCLPLFAKISPFYKKKAQGGKKIFFSKLGYITFGISLGLVILSIIFNLTYVGGWFDFTDLGFALLSYPLVMFTKFEVDTDQFLSRLTLYFIVVANLLIVNYAIDFSVFLGTKAVGLFRRS
jgi:hypothetical protein